MTAPVRGGRGPALALFGPAVAWLVAAGVGLVHAAEDDRQWSAPKRAFGEVVGSDDCRRCHPAQYDSWHRTYHRTMTQRVDDPDARVLAPFAGEQLRYGGFVATMDRSPAGTPHVSIRAAGNESEPLVDADVEFSVGSHRYQQYVARIDRGGGADERWRLPVAWHAEAGRWIHLNGAFLEPEATPGDAEGYLRHLGRWNDNCVFCHNTEPVPGASEDGFETRVGEVGIACEACHGSGRVHVRRHADPFRRMLARGDGDPSITHPDRLAPARATDLCGRCHGQRIGHDIGRILAEGDGFVPGQALAEVSRPIVADSEVRGLPPKPFAERFWADGTPRLSAYEYQALLASACHQDGEGLSCNDCHDMHGSDPDGQVARDRRGEDACTSCHAPSALSAADGTGGHGGHEVFAPAVDCLDCHMPRVTYGLLLGMRTHRIQSPDLASLRAADSGELDDKPRVRPDACTQCHTDRDRAWAIAGWARLGLSGEDRRARTPGVPTTVSRVAEDLVSGDPVQRALACAALGASEAAGDPRLRAAWLAEGLDDGFVAVRFMAWRALLRLAREGMAEADARPIAQAATRFDPFDVPERRIARAAMVRAAVQSRLEGAGEVGVAPSDLGADWLDEHRARSDAAEIWIGE